MDNRDLTAPRTDQESLAHWPTVEAWWISRLGMHGPAGELCDLIYIPISSAAGLEHVHPTWAGTFVLAALVFLFPGIYFVLLDSDCVPVTLFEVADLWKEISLLRTGLAHANVSSRKGPGSRETSESVPKASKLSHDRWQHQIIGQGVLLVTEHNAEVNAGFIVAFASSHKSAVAEDRWRQYSGVKGSAQEAEVLQHEADRLANLYWDYVHDFLASRRPLEEIDSVECAAWVQTGLALTPFAGCVAQHTCDWTVAWAANRLKACVSTAVEDAAFISCWMLPLLVAEEVEVVSIADSNSVHSLVTIGPASGPSVGLSCPPETGIASAATM